MSAPRVLVTGGGRGIGRAIALRFAREGAMVVVVARTSPELDSVVAEIEAAGGRGLAAQANVSDEGSVEAAVYRAIEFTGGALDVLVNNAGTFDVVGIDKMNSGVWDRHIGVNLTGAFLVTNESLDYLEEADSAHIFNVASTAALQGFAGSTSYCASKYGLRGFGDALREELREKKIRVTNVFPGATRTAMLEKLPEVPDQVLEPEAIADAIWDAYQAAEGANVDEIRFDE